MVYGFSSAEMHSWSAGLTIGALVASGVLLASFVAAERSVRFPLLPLHVITHRARGGAYLSMAVLGAGMFAVFLFMTFYLQDNLGYSPLKTGLGILPLTVAIVIAAPLIQTRILPRVGARAVIVSGMAFGLTGMILFTRLTVGGSYAGQVLPALIPTGIAAASIFSSVVATATLGVGPAEVGIAAALVSTAQQIGGSIGAALLSAIFAAATASYRSNHPHQPDIVASASVHGYAIGFAAGAVFFGVGLVLALTLLPSRRAAQAAATAARRTSPMDHTPSS
jgi:hypothetical protein